MKCIRCDNDSKLSERPGRVCPKCRGTFAFEPKEGDPFTDRAFQNAIDAVSASGTVRFHAANLYYELCRRKRSRVAAGVAFAFAVLFAAAAVGLLCAGHPVVAFVPTLAAGLAGVAAMQARAPSTVSLSFESFRTQLERWTQVHGAPKGLLAPRRKQITARPAELEEELRQYSFDRAVVCDRPETVDVLLANRFHFENNCAILAVGGYPEGAFETVRAMLRNNPKLVVLTAHDATPAGCALAHRLATDPEWFAGGARVIDVGLRPVHAKHFSGQIKVAERERVTPGPGVTEAEAGWLSSYTLELAAVRPEQLVKRLYRAIVHAESGAYADADAWVIFGEDAGTSDGGADSFG